MNIIGCLDHPTSGAYRFDGKDVGSLDRKELARSNRKLGFVFQGFNLLNRHTAVENVELPLLYAGIAPRVRRRRPSEMLDLVGLGERAHHMPNQLSGGQQQRVAIARAMVNQPQVILADEPTGKCRLAPGEEILAEFQRINREHGQTIVMVTHDPVIAGYAFRQVHVKDGLIESDVSRPWLGPVDDDHLEGMAAIGAKAPVIKSRSREQFAHCPSAWAAVVGEWMELLSH